MPGVRAGSLLLQPRSAEMQDYWLADTSFTATAGL